MSQPVIGLHVKLSCQGLGHVDGQMASSAIELGQLSGQARPSGVGWHHLHDRVWPLRCSSLMAGLRCSKVSTWWPSPAIQLYGCPAIESTNLMTRLVIELHILITGWPACPSSWTNPMEPGMVLSNQTVQLINTQVGDWYIQLGGQAGHQVNPTRWQASQLWCYIFCISLCHEVKTAIQWHKKTPETWFQTSASCIHNFEKQERVDTIVSPLWASVPECWFRSKVGTFVGSMAPLASMMGGAGGKMANLAALGHRMTILAVQSHSWPFWRASTTVVKLSIISTDVKTALRKNHVFF